MYDETVSELRQMGSCATAVAGHVSRGARYFAERSRFAVAGDLQVTVPPLDLPPRRYLPRSAVVGQSFLGWFAPGEAISDE